MTDREKVLQWLEACSVGCEEGCPYEYDGLVSKVECKADLMRDALELLKEYEPRVLQLSEINKYDFVWCEHHLMDKLCPAIVADCNSVTCHEFFVKNYIFEVTRYMPEDIHYEKTWRCWNHKPTDEQRKAVKWNEP